MIVRQAVEADLPQMLTIYNDVILNTTAVYDYKPHTLAMRKEWFDTKQTAGIPIFVAVEGDDLLGFSSYGPFRAWAAYQYTVENSVYVDEKHRGKGIAKALLAPVIEDAKQQGKHTIVAGIDASNESSIALHRRFGFEEVARFREVGFKFDKWLDLVFMQLIL